jgi:hypothetical protein
MKTAADQLGVGMTVLKKWCRRNKVVRWPGRKLASLDSLIESLKKVGGRPACCAAGHSGCCCAWAQGPLRRPGADQRVRCASAKRGKEGVEAVAAAEEAANGSSAAVAAAKRARCSARLCLLPPPQEMQDGPAGSQTAEVVLKLERFKWAPARLPTRPPACPPTCPPARLPTCPPARPPTCPLAHLPARPPACLKTWATTGPAHPTPRARLARRQHMLDHPNTDFDAELKKLRQSNFKNSYRMRASAARQAGSAAEGQE